MREVEVGKVWGEVKEALRRGEGDEGEVWAGVELKVRGGKVGEV